MCQFLLNEFHDYMLPYLETESFQDDDEKSSPIFYEQPGIPVLDEDDYHDSTTSSRRVRFSTAPIRVRIYD